MLQCLGESLTWHIIAHDPGRLAIEPPELGAESR